MEVNPRASRTVPYVSKATGVPMAKIAARLMTGRKLRESCRNLSSAARSRYGHCYYVNPVFPWNKFPGVDTFSAGDESTGEVMGGDNFGETFAKPRPPDARTEAASGHGLHQRYDHDKPVWLKSRASLWTWIQARGHAGTPTCSNRRYVR